MAPVTSRSRPAARRTRRVDSPPEYLGYIHNFRGFAAMFIVLKRALANGTIFFLFISGYLFQHLSARYRPGDYFLKRIRFVAIPYLLVSLPALLIFTSVLRRPELPAAFYDQPAWRQVVQYLATGSHLAPFWYIPTLFVFYLSSPLLHWLDRRRWFYYSLPFLFLISALSRFHLNPLQAFLHYLPVWVLGMACSRYRITAERWVGRFLNELILLVVLLFVLECLLAHGTHNGYSLLQKGVASLVLLEGFRRLGSGADHWFARAGTLSFGIYFLHSYVVSAAKILGQALVGGIPRGGLFIFAMGALLAIAANLRIVDLLARLLGRFSRGTIGVDLALGRRPAPSVEVSPGGVRAPARVR